MLSSDTQKRNGTSSRKADPSSSEEHLLSASTEPGECDALATQDSENGSHSAARSIYIPTIEEIKSELWWIATGEGSESSRVSALRALADIMGLMKPAPPEFPEGMTALLDALAEGLGNKT